MKSTALQKTSPTKHQIIQAIQYFNTPLQSNIKQSIFQKHLIILQNLDINKLAQLQLSSLFSKVFYTLIDKYEQYKLEQHLFLRFVSFMQKICTNSKMSQQIVIILIWSSTKHLKKSSLLKENKENIYTVLKLFKILIQACEDIQKIYPQVSSAIMQYSAGSQIISQKIVQVSLQILSYMLNKIFTNQQNNSQILPIRQPNGVKSFRDQCTIRLQPFLQSLIKKMPYFQLSYHHILANFVMQTWHVAKKQIKLLGYFAIIGQLYEAYLKYDQLTPSLIKLAHSAITNQFINMLSTSQANVVQRSNSLQILQKLSGCISPNVQQCQQILTKFQNCLFLIYNSKSLIIPQSIILPNMQLIPLLPSHSFKSYSVAIRTLIQCFDFECQRILLLKMPYAQTSLSNIHLIRKIAENIPTPVSNAILLQLSVSISQEQNQYMVDMSLTKFYQFLTKILLIYWVIKKPGLKIGIDVALSLFQVLSTSQSIRILQPSFSQQQMLIGFTLLICQYCYNILVQSTQKHEILKPIKKLKLKLSILQLAINNMQEQSYVIRCATYYIMLSMSAPGTVQQMLQPLAATLINRNSNNMKFIISVVQLCLLKQAEYENMAQKFIKHNRGQDVLKLILPKLKTQTIRKCLLSSSSHKGRWVHMLIGNTKLLHNQKIQQGKDINDKIDNFYMSDGQNVTVPNALGVILLQLGTKWENVLQKDSPYKQPALDLLIQLIHLNPGMVFFKLRFLSIINKFATILVQPQFNSSDTNSNAYQRTRKKIYTILSLIPQQNYKVYLRQLNSKSSIIDNKQKILSSIMQLLQNVKNRHKKYQLNYLMNSSNKEASQMYEKSNLALINLTDGISAVQQSKS